MILEIKTIPVWLHQVLFVSMSGRFMWICELSLYLLVVIVPTTDEIIDSQKKKKKKKKNLDIFNQSTYFETLLYYYPFMSKRLQTHFFIVSTLYNLKCRYDIWALQRKWKMYYALFFYKKLFSYLHTIFLKMFLKIAKKFRGVIQCNNLSCQSHWQFSLIFKNICINIVCKSLEKVF